MVVFKIWALKKIVDEKEHLLEVVNADRVMAKIPSYPDFDMMLREAVRDIAVGGEKLYNDYLSGANGGFLEFYDWITGTLRFRSEQPVEKLRWVNLPLGTDDFKSYKPAVKIEGKGEIEYVLVAVHTTQGLAESLKTAFEYEEAVSRHAGMALTYLSISHALQIYINRRLNDIYRVMTARIEGKKVEEELKVEGKEKEAPKAQQKRSP